MIVSMGIQVLMLTVMAAVMLLLPSMSAVHIVHAAKCVNGVCGGGPVHCQCIQIAKKPNSSNNNKDDNNNGGSGGIHHKVKEINSLFRNHHGSSNKKMIPASSDNIPLSSSSAAIDTLTLANLVVVNTSASKTTGEFAEDEYHIHGEVFNNGTDIAELVTVNATLYDRQNNILGQTTQFVQNVPPLQSTQFEMLALPGTIQDRDINLIDHFTIKATTQQK